MNPELANAANAALLPHPIPPVNAMNIEIFFPKITAQKPEYYCDNRTNQYHIDCSKKAVRTESEAFPVSLFAKNHTLYDNSFALKVALLYIIQHKCKYCK
jgi:hypothetical protein